MEEEKIVSYHDKWEREYRRRMRRRKVIIARIITGAVCLLLLLLLFNGARALVRHIGGGKKEKAVSADTKKEKKEKGYDMVYVPQGYETQFEDLKKLEKAAEKSGEKKQQKGIDYVIRNISDYPVEYLDMLLENVETLEYVKNYPEHKYDTKAGKIDEKITVGKIPLLNQWDTRWGYLAYGNNKLAWNGCGPTALSMVLVGLTGDTSLTPKKVAEYSEANDYYDNDVGTKWSLMSQGAAGLGLAINSIPLDTGSILEELRAGNPIICSMMPGDFTDYGHFIVLTGIDKEGKIKVNDPNSIARSKKHWEVDVLAGQIKGLWSYTVA